MALNGSTSYVGQYSNSHQYFVDWTATQSGAISYLTVRMRLTLLSNYGSWNTQYVDRTGTIFINGVPVYGSTGTQRSLGVGTHTLWSNTYSITHTTSNPVSFTISWNQDTPGSGGRLSQGNTTFTLDAITLTSACGPPTACSVNLTGYRAPNASVTLSWSGAANGTGNTINNYRVERKIGSGSWALLVNVASTSTSSSTTVTVPADRGNVIYYRVRTEGTAGSSYYSGFKEATNSFTVNRLPSAPTINSGPGAKVSSGTSSVTFTLTAGADQDGQTRTLYRSTTPGGTKTLITSPNTVSISSGANTFYFFTYDGVEYSSATSYSVERNVAPTISTISWTAGIIPGANSTPNWPLMSRISVTYTTSKTGITEEWFYKRSTTTTLGAQTSFTPGGPVYNFDISKISGINRGDYYTIGLRVTDGYDTSAISWCKASYGYQRPRLPQLPTIGNFFNKYNSAVTTSGSTATDFSSGITITWTNPTTPTGYANIRETRLVFQTRATSSTAWSTTSTSVAGSKVPGNTSAYSANITTPTRGHQVRFGVRIIDEAGEENIIWKSTIYTRATLPAHQGKAVSVSFGVFKPMSMTSTGTTLPFSIPTYTTNTNTPRWTLTATIGSYTVSILTGVTNSSTATQEIKPTYKQLSDAFKIEGLKTGGNWNTLHKNVVYQAYMTNAFGDSSAIAVSAAQTVDFRENPVLEGALNVGIRYNAASTGVTNIRCPLSGADAAVRKHTRMINPKEHIVLAFAQATDLNNDIVFYEVQYTTADTQPTDVAIAPSTDSLYSNLVTLPKGNMFTGSLSINGGTATSKNIFSFVRPELGFTKFCWFRMRAVDSMGLTSAWIYSDTFLILCTVTPSELSIEEVSINASNQLIVKYTVPNLGGAVFETGSGTYQNYPNLERTISDLTMPTSGTLKIEYSLSSSFTPTTEANYGSTSPTLTKGSYYTEMNGVRNRTTPALAAALQGKRLYVRISLTLVHSLTANTTVSSFSNIYVFYVEEPTWSQRANWFGINTRQVGENEVFRVAAFGSSKTKIRLIGLGDKEIVIDLSTGEIDGATISGGAW